MNFVKMMVLGCLVFCAALPAAVDLNRSEEVRIERISFSNANKMLKVAHRIFPGNTAALRASYLGALLPSWILGKCSRYLTGVPLKSMDYYSVVDRANNHVLGITGLYSVRGRNEAWVGWYGVDAAAQGRGLGKALLLWTIERAREEGNQTLRLWTTTAPDYARAIGLYEAMGFVQQDTGLVDPDYDNASLLLYSLSLSDQTVVEFTGSMKEALLGATDADLARLVPRSDQP